MTNFWDERYSEEDYAYGLLPNSYVKIQLDKLPPGNILFPAEGEGRNAVYAAKKGWMVTAFDSSKVAKHKALALSKLNHTTIDYVVSNAEDFTSNIKFEVLVLNYAHFPKGIRRNIHKHLISFLKPKATIIFEAFSKNQLQYSSGGPKDKSMLFSINEIKNEFPNINFKELKEENIQLNEGRYHQGMASVVRFTGELIK
ncbi:class I SAM-dependent methyltransferase [Wenyingzhuangia marina]|uniref:Methyltransferase domain-containing protein n=1 Tax=Wenyingzhuangia marina TaxID=1195760 RepID=A0A1M5VKL2_9FLAO|nr:class I SAM-dependent methyltransferase [Wenyingzhuangia marina]GGF71518.1 methyltransferase [Wenyingzhuangia marina]SHH75755.1 hypothetical protein SAMN05444281_1874 [Wenyingzhuangia marina]